MLKEVVDEIHLLKCEALQNVRTPFIDLINKIIITLNIYSLILK
jgi:hypothetical protein